ncbi:MAG TPA: serine/threonine-protein kinase [Ktedonobacterales bacterium]|nr:serine/threonine-protein kinase [Ktedonobacterales bacterium]
MLEQRSYTQWIGAALGEYRLTRLLGAGPMGPLFAADAVNSASTFLVRVLAVPPAQTPDALQTYQAYLERQAGHVSGLRHPFMLPLVNYGMFQGMPYFVWPYTTMRSLTTRLTQSGVLDVVTMGRYLDQIAAALEYAHQNMTFHRNLSLDCIYLQMDGQIAVADFGVRRLFELLTPGVQPGFFYGSLEACAPEQLTGGQVGPATDVYALGAVTYRLLTGHSVFSGENFRALAEQHLHASPLPLARTRPGLPVMLDPVLAGALAKDPAQRIQHPGTFADAYHQIVAPSNTRRVPFDVAGGPPVATPSQVGRQPGTRNTAGPSPSQGYPRARLSYPPVPAGGVAPPSTSSQGMQSFFARGWWFFVLVLVLVPLVTGGVFFLASRQPAVPKGPGGTLLFVDSTSPSVGSNDGLRITAQGLAAPAAGTHYRAWLVNQQTEQIIALGQMAVGANNTYRLAYHPAGVSGKPNANVLAVGDMVEITEEHSNVAAPAGRVLLQVRFPPKSFTHIKHLLLTFPTTPGQIGLLVGVLRQTQLLNAQVGVLTPTVGSGQATLVRCLAQSIVDISEGKPGAHYRPLGSECAALGVTETGDGFGLLNDKAGSGSGEGAATGYIKNAADHASLAVNAPDATDAIRRHAGQVETTLSDVNKSVTEVDSAALKLLASPNDTAAAAALASASTQAYRGTGGALVAYQQGQQMATLSLTQPTA